MTQGAVDGLDGVVAPTQSPPLCVSPAEVREEAIHMPGLEGIILVCVDLEELSGHLEVSACALPLPGVKVVLESFEVVAFMACRSFMFHL